MSDPFRIGVLERSLVISFAQPCQVVSWAPLHVGFQTGVSYVLIHRVVWADRTELLNRELRRAVGKMGLRGTVVGMATATDLHSHRVVGAINQDVCVSVLALLSRLSGLDAQSGNSKGDLGHSISTNLLVFVNRRLSQEAMLEAMALAVEVRTRALEHAYQTGELSMPCASATRLNCVAVSTYEGPSQRYSGDDDQLRELIMRTLTECCRPI